VDEASLALIATLTAGTAQQGDITAPAAAGITAPPLPELVIGLGNDSSQSPPPAGVGRSDGPPVLGPVALDDVEPQPGSDEPVPNLVPAAGSDVQNAVRGLTALPTAVMEGLGLDSRLLPDLSSWQALVARLVAAPTVLPGLPDDRAMPRPDEENQAPAALGPGQAATPPPGLPVPPHERAPGNQGLPATLLPAEQAGEVPQPGETSLGTEPLDHAGPPRRRLSQELAVALVVAGMRQAYSRQDIAIDEPNRKKTEGSRKRA